MFEILVIVAMGGVISAIMAIRFERKKRNKAQSDWEHFQRTGNLKKR